MSFVNKILINLVGEDQKVFSQQSPISKKKILSQSSLLLIPSILWFLIGCCISSVYFQTSTGISLTVGLFCALIVFIIDRSILISQVNRKIGIIRFFLAILMALLGGELLNLYLFKNDISQFKLEQEVSELKNKLLFNEFKYNSELNGQPNSSGKSGFGPVAKEKKKLMEIARVKLNEKEFQLKNMNTNGEVVYVERGLLDDTSTLLNLFKKKPFALVLYAVFSIILLLLELLVVLNKFWSSETAYEKAQKVYEDINKMELDLLQKKITSQIVLTDQEKQTNRMITNNPSVYI